MKDGQSRVVELDVRDMLKRKLKPLPTIMKTVRSLEPEDTFILHATFKPVPLLTVMKKKGYANRVEKISDDHWKVTFFHTDR